MNITRKPKRSQEEIAELLYRYHQSGVTVGEFAVREQVAPGSIYKWLRREKAQHHDSALVEVSPPVMDMEERFQITTTSGHRIDVPDRFVEETLKQLMRVIR